MSAGGAGRAASDPAPAGGGPGAARGRRSCETRASRVVNRPLRPSGPGRDRPSYRPSRRVQPQRQMSSITTCAPAMAVAPVVS